MNLRPPETLESRNRFLEAYCDELRKENNALRVSRDNLRDEYEAAARTDGFAKGLKASQDLAREMLADLRALPAEWREMAGRVNQPDSPSLLIECAEQLEKVLGEMLP